MEKYVRNLMNVFEESFINRLNELILIPKTNLYICLDDVHNETELKYKIIEFCSRDASKAMPYKTEQRNKKYQSKVRDKILFDNDMMNVRGYYDIDVDEEFLNYLSKYFENKKELLEKELENL